MWSNLPKVAIDQVTLDTAIGLEIIKATRLSLRGFFLFRYVYGLAV